MCSRYSVTECGLETCCCGQSTVTETPLFKSARKKVIGVPIGKAQSRGLNLGVHEALVVSRWQRLIDSFIHSSLFQEIGCASFALEGKCVRRVSLCSLLSFLG